jgi:hypothetical protein
MFGASGLSVGVKTMTNDEVDDFGDENTNVMTSAIELPTFEEEVEVWRERSHILWLRAVADGDLRAMAAAVQVALRGLDAWQAQIAEEQEKATEKATADNDDPNDPRSGAPSVAWMDRIVRSIDENEARALASGEIRCPVCWFKTVSPAKLAERLPDVLEQVKKYEESRSDNVNNSAR